MVWHVSSCLDLSQMWADISLIIGVDETTDLDAKLKNLSLF